MVGYPCSSTDRQGLLVRETEAVRDRDVRTHSLLGELSVFTQRQPGTLASGRQRLEDTQLAR